MLRINKNTPAPAYLKLAKLQPPKAYDGKDDLDAFELWLRNLLEYFYTLRITGPSLDIDRLRLLSTSLMGEAARWYYNTVQSSSREKRDWTFEEATVGLFRRFIHCDNYLLAEQQFAKLRYDAGKGGVAALYERLLYAAERMWEKPSKFQMRTRFLDALPEDFERILTVINGLSVKYNSLTEIYQAALDLEQSLRAMQTRRRAKEMATQPTSRDNHGKNTRDSSKPRPNTATIAKPATGRFPSNRLSSGTPKTGDNNRPRGVFAAGDKPRPSISTNNRNTRPVAASQAAQTCFSCGQVGHFASDPACPNAGNRDKPAPRMFAQRVIVEDPDIGENIDVDPGDTPEEGKDVELGEIAKENEGQEEGIDYPQSDYDGRGSQYESPADDGESQLDELDFIGYHAMRLDPDSRDANVAAPRLQMMTAETGRDLRNAWLYDAKVR